LETRLAWYLVSSASFVIPLGVGQLLLPWLLAIYLEESATRIGLAQMIAQLPVVMLVLWGGWLGDRMDQRRLLIYLTGIMAIPPLVLAAIFYWGSVTYALVVVYSVIMGCFMAFVQPARDALVNRVAGQRIQQVVTITVGLQWGVQIIGFAIGSTADFVGPTILLLLISLFMGAAMLAVKLIPPLEEIENEATDGIVSQIKDGLRIAWSNLKIRTAMLQILALAVFFSGAYLVLLPVMIRELYGGGSLGLAGGFGFNLAGTVLATLVLMKTGRIRYPGRALIFGTVFSCSFLLTLILPLVDWLFYLILFFWGAGGGLIVIMSRSIVQENAPDTHRARIMSIFSLAMMGGSPIGSLLMGLLIDQVGVHMATLFPVIGMIITALFLVVRLPLWGIQSASVN
jgi:MFS family permease